MLSSRKWLVLGTTSSLPSVDLRRCRSRRPRRTEIQHAEKFATTPAD